MYMRRILTILPVIAVAAAAIYVLQPVPLSSPAQAKTPEPKLAIASKAKREKAVFAGGCFWGVEGVFDHVKGVISARSGYAGGTASTANYGAVSAGRTDHAEAVEITYNPSQIGYADLLRIFFSVAADPTTLNRQGPDVGRQYRTAIFPTSPDQAKMARAYIDQLTVAKSFARPIVTKVEPSARFYPAEAKHQDFMAKHPNNGYIVINDKPKVQALKKQFPTLYRS